MAWIPPAIDWLDLRTNQDLKGALEALVNSNLVVRGSVHRPTGYRNQMALYQALNAFAQRELANIVSNFDAYAGSQDVQKHLMAQITKKLIREHYVYQLTQCGPQPASCKIYRAQVWRPASYYIVKGNTVFDWESAQTDFYEQDVAGRRHPAIVTAVSQFGVYWLVPCSHSRGGGSVKIMLGSGDEGYAVCRFSFRASWFMLCGDPNAIDRHGLRVTDQDFAGIQLKLRGLLRQRP